MNFLKALGIDIAKGLAKILPFVSVIDAVVPSAAPVVDKIASELNQFVGVITTVEAVSASLAQPIPGALKLQQAIPQISLAVKESAFMVGKTIADTALYDKAAQEFAQATVDLLNSLAPVPAA
jgi:hypothetical protein